MTILHTGASPRLRATKRVAALLLLPITLLLSACRTDADVTVTAAGGIHFTVDIIGDTKADVADVDCNSYGSLFDDYPGEVKVNDYMSDPSTDVLCQIVGQTDNGMDGTLLIDNDSSYILNIPVNDFLANAESDVQGTYHLAVHMPGDIIFASGNGKIDGSTIVYEGDVSELNGDIKIEANKSSGTPFAVWVVGLLVVLLGGALGVSRYLRAKDSSHDTVLPKFFTKKNSKSDKGDKKSKVLASGSTNSGSSGSVSVATNDSTVTLAPLPAKYSPKNIDGISESYSEQIDMVSPIPQGVAADVVKRENVLLALPSETADVLPIPGMPPRIPMSDDSVQTEVGEVMDGDESALESKPETTSESEASEFFSQFFDEADDEDIDEETDL